MTTQYWSSVISMADTTATRAWGAELKAKMAAAGVVQTADTGQVDWASVARPAAANLIIGYEIWRLPDSSLYFKMEYWTGVTTVTNSPQFWLTVGTGSDGAGGITGTISTRTNLANVAQAISSATTPRASYCCCTADFFGLAFKVAGAATTPSVFGFSIEKFVDVTGAATTDGFVVRMMGLSTTALQIVQAVRTASPATVFAATTAFCLVPANVTASADELGNNQVFLHSHPSPRGIFGNFTCTVIVAEVALGNTFSVALVGATAKTFMGLGNALGTGNTGSALATWGTAFLWQ